MLGEFERNASATRDRVLSEARAEAQRLEQDGRRTAEARRAEIIAQAQADAHAMEVRAAGRLGDAVQFILDQITKPT